MYNGGHLRVSHRRSGPGAGAGYPYGVMADPSDRPLLFGSPSYPTPLDRVRSGRRERAAQLGLSSSSSGAPSEVWLDRRRCSTDGENAHRAQRGNAVAVSSPSHRTGSGVLMQASRLREAGRRWFSRDKDVEEEEEAKRRGDEEEDSDGSHRHCSRRVGVHCALEDFTGSGINDVSFSCVGGPPLAHVLLEGSQTLGDSWALFDYVQHATSRLCPASTVRNPNKALCTISARTSEILTANEMAVALFAVSEEELLGRRLSEFVKLKYKNTHVTESHLEADSGQLVEISGRVLECEDSTGLRIPVSVWLTRLSSGQETSDGQDMKCLVALEPVERLTALLLLSPTSGKAEDEKDELDADEDECGWVVTSCDQQALGLFECSETNELVGRRLDQFITSLEEMSSKKKRNNIGNKKVKLSITGRTRLGKAFPCFAIVQRRTYSELSARSDNPAYAQLLGNISDSHLSVTEADTPEKAPWLLTLWLFANISGLLTVRPSDGCIHSCNATLAQMLFGYSKASLMGQPITTVIPNFYSPELDMTEDSGDPLMDDEEEGDYRLPPLDEDDMIDASDSMQNTSELLSEARAMLAELAVNSELPANTSGDSSMAVVNFNSNAHSVESGAKERTGLCPESESTPIKSGTSTVKAPTPPEVKDEPPPRVPFHSLSTSPVVREGCFQGRGRHRDGSSLELIYAVRNVDLLDSSAGESVTVVWVSRNPERQNFAPAFSLSTSSPFWSREVSRDPGVYQPTSTVFSDMNLYGGDGSRGPYADRSWSYFSSASRVSFNAAAFSPLPQSQPPLFRPPHSASILEEPGAEEEPGAIVDTSSSSCSRNGTPAVVTANVDSISDPLERDYEPLTIIGKGAFGFVRLARCRRTREEVVVKHIRKSKLVDSNQFTEEPGSTGRYIPREAAILMTLDHPHIVHVLACHEGKDFWHMVMPKHGDGMDLFEFIDRSPHLDEPLVSYIFRQLVSAVHYLHRRGIVHRDIKDENIILDDKFSIKLIDFGAAARLEPGKKFRVFCGTLEFCSPEILLGNEYRGPEADVWSMGITLYTLMFGENPFYDHEETIHGVLKPPFKISPKLLDLLSIMLATDPTLRADVATVRVHPWLTQFVDIEKYKFSAVLPNHDFVGNTGSDFRQYSQEPLMSSPVRSKQAPAPVAEKPSSARSQSDSGVASSPPYTLRENSQSGGTTTDSKSLF